MAEAPKVFATVPKSIDSVEPNVIPVPLRAPASVSSDKSCPSSNIISAANVCAAVKLAFPLNVVPVPNVWTSSPKL